MNTNWKISTLALAAVLSLTTASAQKDKKDKSERRNQTITIVRSGERNDSTEKMTIVVDGDKVTINGKPVEDFKDSDVRVITSADHFRAIAPGRLSALKGARAPMAIGGIDTDDVFSWNSNKAVLGVSTEDGDGGAKVTDITKDGAAEKAGLKTGDVITKVNDFNVADADDLPMALNKMKPEEKVTITYKRDGKVQTASATLQKGNDGFAQAFTMTEPNIKFNFNKDVQGFAYFGKPRLGLQVEDLEEGSGVKVLDVNEETPAAKAGLKKDDVITSFNGKEIKGVDDIRSSMKEVKQGETIKVIYKRGGSTQNAEIKFPKPVKKATI